MFFISILIKTDRTNINNEVLIKKLVNYKIEDFNFKKQYIIEYFFNHKYYSAYSKIFINQDPFYKRFTDLQKLIPIITEEDIMSADAYITLFNSFSRENKYWSGYSFNNIALKIIYEKYFDYTNNANDAQNNLDMIENYFDFLRLPDTNGFSYIMKFLESKFKIKFKTEF